MEHKWHFLAIVGNGMLAAHFWDGSFTHVSNGKMILLE